MKLPSDELNNAFSEINIIEAGNELEVNITFAVDIGANNAEGWMTGIAIDASTSMLDSFGFGLKGSLPSEIKNQYIRKGLINSFKQDGRIINYFTEKGVNKAILEGYLTVSPNIVQDEVQKFSEYCALNLSIDGNVGLMYWSLDESGEGILEIGNFSATSVQSLKIEGPSRERFGSNTCLLPALKLLDSKYNSAKRTMCIFITDGEISDLEGVKKYTTDLAKRIESGKRNFLKAILIGVGDEINEKQMDELDNLDTGTSVDIWDHKIAHQMKDMLEIFSELVDENQIVAQFAKIFDEDQKLVKSFNDGLPAKIKVSLPMGSKSFCLEADGTTIIQKIKGF